MKILIGLFVSLMPFSLKAQETIDLFILAGQSNAQGWTGDAAQYPREGIELDTSILLNWTFFNKESSNGEWQQMQAQKGRFTTGHFGPEVSFSRALKKAGFNPAIFKYCQGATGLSRDWKKPGEGGIYDHMVTDLRVAIKDLERQNYKVVIRGFIWIQGETDAGDDFAANAYQNNLEILLDDLRKTGLVDDKCKIILGVDEQHKFVKKRSIVVEAQKNIANKDPNIVFTSMYGLPKADGTHLTPEGLVQHGQRLFNAYMKLDENPQEKIAFGDHDLVNNTLAQSWDEGIPLGNGIIGSLVWQKEGNLRLSLDRVDLWDLRPMENLNTPNYKFSWVYKQWKNDNYKEVQNTFDVPYDRSPAPSKIPGAGMEFDIKKFGKISTSRLSVSDAICEIIWENGIQFNSFVHASKPVGWFRFKGVENNFKPVLIPPAYHTQGNNDIDSPVTGQDLRRLGYPTGNVSENNNNITYTQAGWGGFTYEVHVSWVQKRDVLEGCWSISSSFPGWDKTDKARTTVKDELDQGFQNAFTSHKGWWRNYWAKSSINIPDSILEKQWYLEQYKFGSAARDGAPPISLQAVWTADNGKLPPWKGDFHHDLNTQLSYWPAYSGNHLDLEKGFLNWLIKYKSTFKKYTKEYYDSEGLNVPGVTTLTGDPMGGWIQYSFGPTIGAWLGHHFYLHWRYSMDRTFLSEKAYPWISEVALFFDEISIKNNNGKRKLLISSSPEIYDNSKEAWFSETTNFDLALIRWTYEKSAELALELGKKEEANKWKRRLAEWPELRFDDKSGLIFAPGTPYVESHRHFSHLVGFHPLGIVDRSKGKAHQALIENTLENLLEIGSDWFTGYSFSWLGNLQARNFDGEGAAKSLRIFAENFCLPNSFHVNGEQQNKGFSKFKYRPFTLEGNFAFASAIQEMLIQSHTETVHIMPAVPASWENISFKQLRTEGAFLVSAKKENGVISEVKVQALAGGVLKLKNPFGNRIFNCSHDFTRGENNLIIIKTNVNDQVVLNL